MSIQRWAPPLAVATRDDHGQWVKYDDHVAEVERLTADLAAARAERDGLAKALHELAEYADASIGSQYGTLRASLVRDIVHEALAALPPKEDDDA